MKRSLVGMASAAASLVLTAAAPAVSTGDATLDHFRAPPAADAGRMTFDASGGTIYVMRRVWLADPGAVVEQERRGVRPAPPL
jgi:hypothetical protein